MRIRTIKPEFWEDDVVASIRRDARLLFIATFNLADDEGLLRWTPEYLKASAFMYDDDLSTRAVAGLMGEIADAGLVLPYRGGRTDAQLGWIVNFLRHQRINRPNASKLPAPSLQNGDVRTAYARRDGWTCLICNDPIPQPADFHHDAFAGGPGKGSELTLDHIKPRFQGGSDYPSNIRPAHRSCNSGRRDYDTTDVVNDSLNDSVSAAPPEGKGREGNREGSGRGEEGNGTEKGSARAETLRVEVTHDQLYLAEKLDLTVPAVQKLNTEYGTVIVTDAMRHLHGFPPEEPVESTYAYVKTLCSLKEATA